MYTLTIGDKAYSSWSMRGWLCLAAFRIRFEEEPIPMDGAAFDAMKAERAPVTTVPHLSWREAGTMRRLWDSAAIAETLAERHPEAGLWPEEPWHRGVARTVAAEMHSGLAALRAACPMNLHRDNTPSRAYSDAVERDLDRLAEVWDWALSQTGGPWLGGPRFSVADAFYAPVATRLTSYALMRTSLADYAGRLLAQETVAAWIAAARTEAPRPVRDVDAV